MDNKLTIIDIARLADVSPSAVSFAINNRKGISDATRAKILKIIDEHNFVPNQQARRLLLNYTNNIAVLHELHKSPLVQLFHMDIITSALSKSEYLGYNFVFSPVNRNKNDEIPEIVKNKDVDGIIVLGEVSGKIIEKIEKVKVPFVIIDEHLKTKNAAAIEADYHHGARLAAEFLAEKNHRNIAYIGESREKAYGLQTLSGFREQLKELGKSLPAKYIKDEAENAEEDSGRRCMEKLLRLKNLPSAVFCAADIYAIGALKAIKAAGLKVPRDISLMGMDNIILSSYIEPPLTTIKFHKGNMGFTAIETLVGMIKGEYRGPKKIMFDGEIVERESVRAIK